MQEELYVAVHATRLELWNARRIPFHYECFFSSACNNIYITRTFYFVILVVNHKLQNGRNVLFRYTCCKAVGGK